MDHTARIARRGVVLTVSNVMQLMAVTLAVDKDGRETFVNKVSSLIIEVVHHYLIFDFKVIKFRSHILGFHLKGHNHLREHYLDFAQFLKLILLLYISQTALKQTM